MIRVKSRPISLAALAFLVLWSSGLLIAQLAFPGALSTQNQSPARTVSPSEELLAEWGGASGFPVLYRRSMDAFIDALDDYRAGHYSAAGSVLSSLWREYQPGEVEWSRAESDAQKLAVSKGVNFGTQAFLYALRMLSECVEWRIHSIPGMPVHTLKVTVVLAGRSTGLDPSSMRELQHQAAPQVQRSLDPTLGAGARARRPLSDSGSACPWLGTLHA